MTNLLKTDTETDAYKCINLSIMAYHFQLHSLNGSYLILQIRSDQVSEPHTENILDIGFVVQHYNVRVYYLCNNNEGRYSKGITPVLAH